MINKVNVLVTAIGGGGHGEQILKALKLAQGNRYKLFGGDMNPRCPQFDLVEQGVVLPSANDPNFIDAVLAVCSRYDIKVVFHGCEPELLAYSRARDVFEKRGVILPINRANVIELCMNKVRSSEFLESLGFAPPRFILANNIEQVSNFDHFPLVAKPYVGSGGSQDCFVVQDLCELEAIMSFFGASSEDKIMLQEYVGTPEDEYTVGVLHDLNGEYINSIAVRRELKSGLNVRISTTNRTNRSDLGEKLVISSGVSMGEVCRVPQVLETCKKIAQALDVRGAINFQGRMTDEGFKVFEINPRFSGTTSIRATMGYNEPDVLLRQHLLGESIIPDFVYETGYVLRALEEYRPKVSATQTWQDLL